MSREEEEKPNLWVTLWSFRKIKDKIGLIEQDIEVNLSVNQILSGLSTIILELEITLSQILAHDSVKAKITSRHQQMYEDPYKLLKQPRFLQSRCC